MSESSEALYQKADANGASKKPSSPPHRDIDYPAPSPELQKKVDARKKITATSNAKSTKKTETLKKAAAPKRPAASRKRKASEPEPESSVDIVTNVSNLPETFAPTGAHSELISQIPLEVLASIDTSEPIQILTLPNDDSLPTTPVSKKRQRWEKADTTSPAKPVSFTPTPSGVGFIAGSKNVRKGKGKEEHMLDGLASLNRNRPAAPDVTNAPVLTPNGSQVVVNDSPAKKRKANDLPPDVGSPMKPTSTIDTLLKDAEAELIKIDKEVTGNGRLERLIGSHQCKMFNPEGLREVVDPFTALASGIIGQQVCWHDSQRHRALGITQEELGGRC